MSKFKEEKLTERDPSKNKRQIEDAFAFVETHSQDADRKRQVKHPVSDK